MTDEAAQSPAPLPVAGAADQAVGEQTPGQACDHTARQRQTGEPSRLHGGQESNVVKVIRQQCDEKGCAETAETVHQAQRPHAERTEERPPGYPVAGGARLAIAGNPGQFGGIDMLYFLRAVSQPGPDYRAPQDSQKCDSDEGKLPATAENDQRSHDERCDGAAQPATRPDQTLSRATLLRGYPVGQKAGDAWKRPRLEHAE